ncbi:XAC2610-related protein [Flavobacterium aquiphilum]|uniref:XAC2610-related protein n=1 Tax=Flavobacterium aquiphilum TaxID=3003261 RepID=UPI0024814541|nr:hypothetical protein [Flavobacterium aquiphilum]
MKNLFYIIAILFLVSCKNPIKNTSSAKNTVKDSVSTKDTREVSINDTASTLEIPEIKYDTIVKVSKPFELNGILCNWENRIIFQVIYQEKNVSEIYVNLKNYKNKQILLETPLDVEDSVNYKSDGYFENLNNYYFKDFNFDGFKDFYFYSKGSNEMTSLTNIYLFNNQSKTFEYSEYLSASHIEDINKNGRKLITENSGMDYGITNTHYFDKFGKLKYTEVVTEYINPHNYKIYEKIINGEVVKRDSIFISKE